MIFRLVMAFALGVFLGVLLMALVVAGGDK